MPYPNEHACRLIDPKTVNVVGSRKRNAKNGKQYRILFGIPKRGDGSVEYAYRYPKDTWSANEARAHCKEHKGGFEAALVKQATSRLISAARKK